MSEKVYVIKDPTSIAYIEDNDIVGFKKYLEEEDALCFDEPIEFETQQEVLSFCLGLGYGADERGITTKLPLRSFEEYDQPFISLIETRI